MLRVLPTLLLVMTQLLAFTLLSASGFWILSETARSHAGLKIALRSLIAVFAMVNCGTSRFLTLRVLSWLGMALNLVMLGFAAALVGIAGSPTLPDRTAKFYPHPSEHTFAVFILSLVVLTIVLQLAFKAVYKGDSVFSLFTGDLTLERSTYEKYDAIDDGSTLPINHSVQPDRGSTIHTQCRVETVPAWFMRLASLLIFASGALMFMLGVGVSIASSESRDQYYLDGKAAITSIYMQNGIVQIIFAFVALFVSIRFSSRRRLLVVICAALMLLVTSIVHFSQVRHIEEMLIHNSANGRSGDNVPGFLWLGFGFVTLWALFASWALKYRVLFDNSFLMCIKCQCED